MPVENTFVLGQNVSSTCSLFGLQDVRYPEYLDLYPFMSETQEKPLVYRLYAVLVHYGRSSHSGHYFCYIKVLALLSQRMHEFMFLCFKTKTCVKLYLKKKTKHAHKKRGLKLRGCVSQASDGHWYQMNDNFVTITDIKSVLTKQAYVLFYIK